LFIFITIKQITLLNSFEKLNNIYYGKFLTKEKDIRNIGGIK